MDLHRIVALQTYLAAQVSQTLRCVSVGFRNVKIRYLMHAPLSHGENALDKGRGDHIMATVRSISESRVIQLSIFSDTRNDRVYAFLDVDSRKKSVNKFGQFNFVVCCNLQYPILPVLILKQNSCPSFKSRSEEHTSELQSLMRISY